MNLSLDVYKMSHPRQLKRVEKNKEQEIKLSHSLLKPGHSILKSNKETNMTKTIIQKAFPPHKGLYYSSGFPTEKQLINTSSGFNVII